MVPAGLTDVVRAFASWTVVGLVGLLGVLVIVGFANAIFVGYRTIRDRKLAADGSTPLAVGFISMYAYLHLLADVLLVVVAVELIETFLAFIDYESPKTYLTGVIGAALVALARRIIVFFNPEAENPHTTEMFAYAGLVTALAIAFAIINQFG